MLGKICVLRKNEGKCVCVRDTICVRDNLCARDNVCIRDNLCFRDNMYGGTIRGNIGVKDNQGHYVYLRDN